MERHGLIKFLIPALVVAAVCGCSYPIAQQYRVEARKAPTFVEVLKDPAAYTGSIVLWGGIIIETVTVSNGSEIFVLQTPLDSMEKPEPERFSQGRFIAKSGSFLDPEIYKNGKRITLAGDIMGKETRPLGKARYPYPVVGIKELHLWRERKANLYPYSYPYYGRYYEPWWGWDWYGPGLWPYWGDWDEEDEE